MKYDPHSQFPASNCALISAVRSMGVAGKHYRQLRGRRRREQRGQLEALEFREGYQ
jgi:hypothetical protein